MADFEAKLQQLSVRGTPVGAEELIERIEAELAGDPLVVVFKQREGVLMTKTDQRTTPKGGGTGRGPAWAVAAFVIVLTVGGLYLAFSGGDGEVADTTPNTETMTDLEIIQAGVNALYSGDTDRAVELFELTGLFPDSADDNDEWIRDEVAYQAAIGGRMTVDCSERSGMPGVFNCTRQYHNAFTDAIGYGDVPLDSLWVVVGNGVIAEFGDFPLQDSELNGPLGAFLREVGESPANSDSDCEFGSPFTKARSPSRNVRLTFECVDFVLDHLDEWAAWAESNFELP